MWSTGATTPSLNVSTSGTYWVTVTNACGSVSDTIQVIVDQPINVNLGADRNICSATPVVLSVPASSTTTYHWSTGATGNQIAVNQSGTYYVTATNACGSFSDTVQLTAESVPNVTLGPDVVKCDTSATTFAIPTSITGTIRWSGGGSGHSLSVNSSGKYWVEVVNTCGTFSDTVEVDYLLPNNFFGFNTASVCTGGSITLSSPAAGNAYLWSTNATTPSIQVSQPGTYWLRITTSCGNVYDTVHVTSSTSAVVDLGPDTIICSGNPIVLDAGNPGSSYKWNTGSKSRTRSVSSTGTYWVGVDNGCGYVYDTIHVQANPTPNPNIDDTIYVCNAVTTSVIDAGSWGANANYLWSDSSQSQVHQGFGPGAHWVQVMNACDTIVKDFFVKNVGLPVIDLGNDTTICGNRIDLDPGLGEAGNDFLWSNNSTSSVITANSTGTYWVEVTNACGTVADTIHVTVMNSPRGISPDTIYKCAGSSSVLSTRYFPNTTYLWSNGMDTNRISVTSPGLYWFYGSNQCGNRYDSVRVIDVQPLNIDLGPDLTFCRPDWVTLDLTSVPADSFVWKGNKTGPTYKITSTGYHWVTAYNICGSFTDTIYATVNRSPRKVLKDTSFCSNASVTLDAQQSVPSSYLWSTGDTTSAITVSQTGWYYVDLFNTCDTIRDSAHVAINYDIDPIDLGEDTIFCDGTLELDAGIPNARYLWHNGDTSRTFTVSQTGIYYVTAYNSCNSVSDTIEVLVTGPPKLSLGNTVKFCRGSTLHLSAQNPGCTYQWSTNETTQVISINNPGKYWVTITNDCGTLTDTVDVIVEDPLDHLSLGNDTIICRGDSLMLTTGIPGVSTKWNDGSLSNSIYVTETGDYWVEVSNSCGSWGDTVYVEVQEVPEFSLGEDTVICAIEGSVDLYGPSGMESYMWSDGSTGKDFTATSFGVYWLTVANKCFSYTDTIYIKEEYPIAIDLGPDTVLCHGESLYLHPQVGDYPVIWSDNTTHTGKEITRSGTYWVMAQNSCGIYTDTISVRFDNHLEPAPEEVTVCRDDTASFDLRGLNQDFVWFDGSVVKQRSFTEEGVYSVTIKNKCGQFRKDYIVDVSNCDCPFFVANAFTPNGDGVNDEFTIGHSCDLTKFEMKVFNRWGNMVFETESSDISWDGTHNGEPVAAGIYTYSINYMWGVYGERHMRSKTGSLTLMR